MVRLECSSKKVKSSHWQSEAKKKKKTYLCNVGKVRHGFKNWLSPQEKQSSIMGVVL